jgi:hypothetical protein
MPKARWRWHESQTLFQPLVDPRFLVLECFGSGEARIGQLVYSSNHCFECRSRIRDSNEFQSPLLSLQLHPVVPLEIRPVVGQTISLHPSCEDGIACDSRFGLIIESFAQTPELVINEAYIGGLIPHAGSASCYRLTKRREVLMQEESRTAIVPI